MSATPDFKHFFGSVPSDQNALDLFSGEWSSSPPADRPELKAGATPSSTIRASRGPTIV